MSNFKFQILILLVVTCCLVFVNPVIAQDNSNGEENAVDNIEKLTRPKIDIIEEQQSPNFIDQINQIFSNITSFTQVFLNPANAFKDKTGFYADSKTLYKTATPDQLEPKSNNFFENLKNSLGHRGSPQVGFYPLGMPEFADQPTAEVKNFEKAYEQANFPPGVCPITGQCPP